jgi:hypothetical protein
MVHYFTAQHAIWSRNDEAGTGQVQDGGVAGDDDSRESCMQISI